MQKGNDVFISLAIDHFRVVYSLGVKTCLPAKPFIWKYVSPPRSFSCKSNSFSYEKFCTKTCFETERNQNSEMAYCKSPVCSLCPLFKAIFIDPLQESQTNAGNLFFHAHWRVKSTKSTNNSAAILSKSPRTFQIQLRCDSYLFGFLG